MDYIEKLKENGLFLKNIPKKEQTKEMCLIALNQNIESYKFIATKLIDKEVLSLIITKGPNQDKNNEKSLRKLYTYIINAWKKDKNLEYIYYLNEDFFIKAMELHSDILCFIPKEKKSYELCLKAVKDNPRSLVYVDTEYLTEDICLEAVKRDGNMINIIPNDIVNEKICLEAVKNNWEAIRYISNKFQTPEVCLLAITQDYMSIHFISLDALNKLDLSEYCFCIERIDIFKYKDETLKNLILLYPSFRSDFIFNTILDKILKLNISTNFLVDCEIEFDKYKELALSNNYVMLIDNGKMDEKYKLLANNILKDN